MNGTHQLPVIQTQRSDLLPLPTAIGKLLLYCHIFDIIAKIRLNCQDSFPFLLQIIISVLELLYIPISISVVLIPNNLGRNGLMISFKSHRHLSMTWADCYFLAPNGAFDDLSINILMFRGLLCRELWNLPCCIFRFESSLEIVFA